MLLVSLVVLSVASSQAVHIEGTPSYVRSFSDEEALLERTSNRVIVKLKDDVSATSFHESFLGDFLKKYPDAEVKYTYEMDGFKGFAIQVSSEDATNDLRSSAEIEYADYELIGREASTQRRAPWNLARISRRRLDKFDYVYSDRAGRNVDVYVLDSGVRTSHDDFENRAIWGTSFTGESGRSVSNGHGTHVAGIVAGKKYGVAKKATVISVRVVDRSGDVYESDLIEGISWSIKNKKRRKKASVMNLSLIFGNSRSINNAVASAKRAGFVVAAAAGNSNYDSCGKSPANSRDVITAGAIDLTDSRWGAYGKCIDIFAPGDRIVSTWIGNDRATSWMSGTSMATPHVSGVAALFLAERSGSPDSIIKSIIRAGTRGGKNLGRGSPSRLLYNNPPRDIIEELFDKMMERVEQQVLEIPPEEGELPVDDDVELPESEPDVELPEDDGVELPESEPDVEMPAGDAE